MATAREETKQHSYEGGGGGKFRKRPFRMTPHTTPYDRPPTAFRNPNGGWLSKLVDPAQRLISSSARRLFSTVFRKRLPPPQPPSSGANREERDKREEAVATDSLGIKKGVVDLSDGPSNSIDGGELTELEQILKQKTFSRSEIDRLTALLHSRTVDLSVGDQEKKPEVVRLNPVAPADRLEGFPKTPALRYKMESQGFLKTPDTEHWTDSQLVSTPVVNSTVVEGDVASPTQLVELAKSYMHKRPTSSSVLGFGSQALKENSTYAHNLSSPLKLPITPLLPRASGHEPRENGFITTRSRGRSAIYSMARTPYSRVRPNTSLKGVENAVDAYAGLSSSSQYLLDQSLSSRSSQGTLKRRSSVMDNDVGSFGAIRRVCQKSNLLSSRGLNLAISGSLLSSSGAGLGFDSAPATSKPLPCGEPVCNSNKPSTENGDNSMRYTIVPSKSCKMASKILQQLDKLVSPKDKSSESKVLALRDKLPSELSPSMLRGQALKSLEDVDSSKFLGDVQDNKKVDGLLSKIIPDAQEFTSQKEEKVKENGPLKLVSADDKLTAKMNGIDSGKQKANGEDSTLSKKYVVCSPETSVPDALNSIAYPPQKKQAFQMSAPEDFLDLDDDSYSNGDVSNALAEGREKVKFSLAERKSTATEHCKLQSDKKKDMGNSAGFMTAEKSSSLILQSTSPSMTVSPPATNTVSHLTDGAPLLESNVYPLIFDNIGGKIVPTKDTSTASPIFNCGLKSSASPILIPFGTSSDPNPETSSNLFAVTAGAIDSLPKLAEPDKAENKNNPNSEVSFRTSETVLPLAASMPTTSTFSFSKTPGDVSWKTGSSASACSTPVVFSSQNSCTSSIFTNSGSTSASLMPASTFASASSSNSLSTSSPASSGPAVSVIKFGSSLPSTAVAPVSETTSAPAGPVKFVTTTLTAAALVSEMSSAPVAAVFKFGSSVPSTASAPVSQTSDIVPEAIKIKQDTSFGNFSSAAAPTASIRSTLFGFTASAAASTSASQSQASTFAPGSASAPSIQVLPTATGVATFSQSIPLQFGSSASSPTFALAGSTTFASGSSPFSSTLPAKSLSSEATNGLGSSSSLAEANSVSSSSSGTPSVFSSSWQTPKSPVFSFDSTLSTGFSFGVVSLAPNAATSSSPSTGFSFGASSASTAANSLPSSGLSFGLSLTSSDATNSPLLPAFSFGASSAPSVAANSSPAVFGATTGSAATNGAPAVFGSSNGASSTSLFSFNSSSGTTSAQPVFGNPSPAYTFGAPSSNNDQMNMEDSMAEDTVQASGPTDSVFGQQPVSPSPSGFVFGSTVSSVGNPFQFGSQPNIANPQNPSPFQNSGGLGLGESNFSMGSGGSGVDKSNRKFVKVKQKQRKK